MTSAVDYVALAEEVSGPIPRLLDDACFWGDALDEFDNSRTGSTGKLHASPAT